MKLTRENLVSYLDEPTSNTMDCGRYDFAIENDDIYFGDYHLNCNSYTEFEWGAYTAYLEIFDNGIAELIFPREYAENRFDFENCDIIKIYRDDFETLEEWADDIIYNFYHGNVKKYAENI